ncbi:hypothetical protein J6590_039935 [Homalodisca vitripennis]|nr:hypothetical protein J6590_039935 [Homalodisca vitripennis]
MNEPEHRCRSWVLFSEPVARITIILLELQIPTCAGRKPSIHKRKMPQRIPQRCILGAVLCQ